MISFASSFRHRENSRSSGRSSHTSTRITGLTAMANFSGCCLASVLGPTSPRNRTSTVITIDATVAPRSSWPLKINMVKSTVAIAVPAMLTTLFPIRTVVSRESYFSRRFSAVCARSFRGPSTVFSFTRLEAEKAVSVAEKKAESAMQIIRATHKPMKAFNPFDYTP